MERNEQLVAIKSNLQAVDFMNAMIILQTPSVVHTEGGFLNDFDTMQVSIEGKLRLIDVTTIMRAALMSGLVAVRTLMRLVGVKATRNDAGAPLTLVEVSTDSPRRPGDDLLVGHIPSARRLTLQTIGKMDAAGYAVSDLNGSTHKLSDALLQAMRTGDTKIAHLTHRDRRIVPLQGDVVIAGLFTCVAIQELVLTPSWGSRMDEIVFATSDLLLPAVLNGELKRLIKIMRTDLNAALSSEHDVSC